MRSVTRKAAITAGLGAALAAGAAGTASAASVPDLVEDLTPVASQAQSALPEAAAPFPLTQVTDKLPVGEALTPGHSPLDNVAGNMARNMEESMGGMEGQAKGGLGSPLGGASPLGQLPTDSLPVAGDANPLQALPLPGGLPL